MSRKVFVEDTETPNFKSYSHAHIHQSMTLQILINICLQSMCTKIGNSIHQVLRGTFFGVCGASSKWVALKMILKILTKIYNDWTNRK